MNAKTAWKAQASAHRAYLRQVRLERERGMYADSLRDAERQLQQIPYAAPPRGYSRPHPPMAGFGLDRFRIGTTLQVWMRQHAIALGIRFERTAEGWFRENEFGARVARLHAMIVLHLAKREVRLGARRQLAKAA